ncbi:MAG: PHP domain-containing protein, partial [Ruminococcus sp.]
MLANYHTHTVRCQHAQGEDKAYVEAAIQSGMKVLGFSDHCPWIYKDGYVSGTRMLPGQLDDYFYSMEQLRREYAREITLYIGFEAEYIPEQMEDQNRLLADYPIDYMILGQHFTSPEPYCAYSGFPTESEAELEKYVDTVIAGMETGKYSYVAHPDLMNFTGSETV